MTMGKIADEINYYKIATIFTPHAEDKPPGIIYMNVQK
jgi:hypothetical protein